MTVMNRIIKDVRLGDKGINLWDAPENLKEGEAMLAQNCYFRRGMAMRLGSLKHSANEVVAGKPIVGLHRYYFDTNGRSLIAASGTNVSYMDDTTGAWTALKTAQTDSTPTYITTWGSTNRAYVANGVDPPFAITNGLTTAALSAAPATTLMFCPYRSRLVSIETANPSDITWCGDDYDTSTWTSGSALKNPGSGANQVLAPHYLSNAQSGLDAKLFVAKPTSCALFSGLDFNPTSEDFQFRTRLDFISDKIGCVSPRTVTTTPVGTIFLGSDRQVYLLPFNSNRLEPIGHKIYSRSSANLGLESIPVTGISKAAAVYHDGFYKLTFPVTGATTNTRQYWLDLDRLYQGENNHYGPWYGPMVGMSISCFVKQNGAGDDGRLLGGEHGASGYVYRVNEPSTYTDNGANRRMLFETRHEYYSDPALDTRIYQSELEMTAPVNPVIMSFNDINGSIDTATTIGSETSTGTYYGELYYGEFYYSGSGLPTRRKLEHYDKFIIGRMISTAIEYTSGTDTLNLMCIRHEANPKRQTFQDRSGNTATTPKQSVL